MLKDISLYPTRTMHRIHLPQREKTYVPDLTVISLCGVFTDVELKSVQLVLTIEPYEAYNQNTFRTPLTFRQEVVEC